MIEAIKEYLKLKLSIKKPSKKFIQVVLLYIAYAATIFFIPNLLSLTFGWSLTFIVIIMIFFATICVPFTTWYLTDYKEKS